MVKLNCAGLRVGNFKEKVKWEKVNLYPPRPSFRTTLWLIIVYQNAEFGKEISRGSKGIVRTKAGHGQSESHSARSDFWSIVFPPLPDLVSSYPLVFFRSFFLPTCLTKHRGRHNEAGYSRTGDWQNWARSVGSPLSRAYGLTTSSSGTTTAIRHG